MAIMTGPDGAMTTITEDQAFRMRTLSRRLCLTLQRLENDYNNLLATGLLRKKDGILEFDSLPVLMDLADESAREMLGMVEGIDNAF